MSFIRFSAVCLTGLLSSWAGVVPASAQDPTCLASFNVRDKPVTLNFGMGAPQILSCKKVEKWRTEYYLANKAVIDAAVSGNSDFLLSQIEQSLAARKAAIEDLRGKIARNESLNSMAIVTKVALGESSKYYAIVGCAATAGLGCAVAIAGVVAFHWDLFDGSVTKSMFSNWADQQRAELQRNEAELTQLKARRATINVSQIKATVEQNFFGTCQAIKRDCLN